MRIPPSFKICRFVIAISCLVGLMSLTHSAFTQEGGDDFFIGNFQDWPLTMQVDNIGPFRGMSDLEVQHPFWVSARPANAPPRDPTDPANIAEAWLTETFTNLRTLDGTAVPGATLHLEYNAVSREQAGTLASEGISLVISSGSFIFALIRQTASPEATEAFGLMTIDNGEFIHAVDTVQGICG